jgi:hypothetical protein
MYWDDLVKRWRRDSRARHPAQLQAAGGHVAVLPERRPRRTGHLLPLILLALAIALALLLLGASEAHALAVDLLAF